MQAVDFFFIQKTGGVPSGVVENIADVKKVKNGTPVNLKLNNAKVTVKAYAMMGSFTVIEDATGAIEGYATEVPAEVEYMTGVIMFDGEQW